jgi:thioredoxin-like negative regulator of GroEL
MSAPEALRAPPTATRVVARPRLVFFYSRSSGACRRAEGFLAQVLQRRGNHDTFELDWVEESERPALHDRFGIDLLPTLVVIEDKRVLGKLVGPAGCRPIERFLSPWLH